MTDDEGECLGFNEVQVGSGLVIDSVEYKKVVYVRLEDDGLQKVFLKPCIPVSEHEAYKEKVTDLVIMEINDLIEWGIQEQAENNVYQKSIDELNEDWLDKIRKLKHNLFSFGLNQSELSSEELKKKELGLSEKAVVEKCVQHKDGRGFTYNEN